MLSASSALAHGATLLGLADNCARLDLAITLADLRTGFDWAACVLAVVGTDKRIEKGITRTTYIRGTPDGTTAYIGSRASERFYRVYDKHAESKGTYPLGAWRFECEYKGSRARAVASRLKGDSGSPERVRRSRYFNARSPKRTRS